MRVDVRTHRGLTGDVRLRASYSLDAQCAPVPREHGERAVRERVLLSRGKLSAEYFGRSADQLMNETHTHAKTLSKKCINKHS